MQISLLPRRVLKGCARKLPFACTEMFFLHEKINFLARRKSEECRRNFEDPPFVAFLLPLLV